MEITILVCTASLGLMIVGAALLIRDGLSHIADALYERDE